MAVRGLREPMRTFRIGDPAGKYSIYSGEGAALYEGRWHDRGQEAIYSAGHYSTAMLEKLAHFNGIPPPNQHFIEIQIPVGTSYEVVTKDSLPGWEEPTTARAFGSKWFSERRSVILIVPSFVAREERNVIINSSHVGAKAIKCDIEKPIWWDARVIKK